jgi:1,4-dihydroxy-2-naphthoate octaprenyltransferase
MATAGEWIGGARPRTLGAAVSPVVVGTAAASIERDVRWGHAALALATALFLQVGVNYANDYSDGVRGTDRDRRGPVRLTASRLAPPGAVRNAAFAAFALAAVAGAVLSLAVDARLLIVGVACLLAAVLYTGGPRPYGYLGLGEVMVLAFFGFVATAGSAYVQLERVNAEAWWGSVAVGLPACGILLANNLRDVDTDRAAGKRTLAVRLGAAGARRLYAVSIAGAFVAVGALGALHGWCFLAAVAGFLALGPLRIVRTRSDPAGLTRALVLTARFQLALALLLALGLALA